MAKFTEGMFDFEEVELNAHTDSNVISSQSFEPHPPVEQQVSSLEKSLPIAIPEKSRNDLWMDSEREVGLIHKPLKRKYFENDGAFQAYEKARVKAEPLLEEDFKDKSVFEDYQEARQVKTDYTVPLDEEDFSTVRDYKIYQTARVKDRPLELKDFDGNEKAYQVYQGAVQKRHENWFRDYALEMGELKTTPDDRYVGREERRRELRGSGQQTKDITKTISYL